VAPKRTYGPRKAPLSIRLGDAREARVRAYQTREGITQTEAIHRLLDQALDVVEPVTNGAAPPPQPAPKASRWSV
jgi:hypothetical protein